MSSFETALGRRSRRSSSRSNAFRVRCSDPPTLEMLRASASTDTLPNAYFTGGNPLTRQVLDRPQRSVFRGCRIRMVLQCERRHSPAAISPLCPNEKRAEHLTLAGQQRPALRKVAHLMRFPPGGGLEIEILDDR